MTEHPSASVLEAFSVGDPVEGAADVAAHVSACDRCRSYLESLDGDRAQFLSDEPAATFLQRPQIRAALDALEHPKRRSWRMLVPAVAAVAAVTLVWPAIERPPESDEVRVKGASSSTLIVNRRRDGKVTAHAGQVTIRPLDQLQLSVQLPEPRTLTVGLLGDDGDWIPLVSQRVFAAGRQPVGADALEVDHSPRGGWLIAGTPAQVEASRSAGRPAFGALLCRIEVEAVR